MRHRSEIIVPVTLASGVACVTFGRKILAALDCPVCKRSRRTVVLYEQQEKSFCTPSGHGFPGHISRLEISRQKNLVTASYEIEYAFEAFADAKHPHRNIGPAVTWSRATFTVTCACGMETTHETQNNIARPWKAACACGQDLYYETSEIPLFRNPG